MAELDGATGTVWIWDADGKPVCRLEGAVGDHPDLWQEPAAFAPDGKALFIAQLDHTVAAWDTTTGKRGRTFGTAKTRRPHVLALSADGKALATFSGHEPKGARNGQRVPEAVRVWDPIKGELLAEWPWEKADPAGIYQLFLGFRANGDVWAVAASPAELTFRRWTKGTGQVDRTWTVPFVGLWPAAAALTPDGSRLAVASGLGVIRLLDAASGKDLTPGGGHRSEVRTVRFTPDGKQLVTIGLDATARTWDAATGKELGSLERLGTFPSLSPDTAVLFDARHTGEGAKGTWVLTGRDATTGRERWKHPGVLSAVPTPDGKALWGRVPGARELTVIDAATGKATGSVPVTGPPIGFGDAGRLAVCFDGKEFSGWDTATRKKRFAWEPRTEGLLRSADGKPEGVGATAVSPDGKFLLVAVERQQLTDSERASLYLCAADTGKVVWQVKSLDPFDRAVAFSPDGTLVAVGGGRPRVYETATGKERAGFLGGAGVTSAVAFSADGKRLASGTSDGLAAVWELPQK
jgi:WD40 repeat protein